LAELVRRVVGFKGKLIFDTTKPDGPPRKLLDVSRLNRLGWYAKTNLETGIKEAYEEYVKAVGK
jgi:GDP-L-fucose synthase